MKKWLLVIIAVLLGALGVVSKKLQQRNEDWMAAMANVKSYSKELSTEKIHNSAYVFTIDQLKTYQDSVLKELDNTRKQLKIKDKELKSMSSIKSEFTKIDTLILNDTIFKEPSFVLDTIVGDEWYNLELNLKYPSTIVTKPEFKSEKSVIISNQKEAVNPPKKFFLLRWFQKKHRVVHIDVLEKNPYIVNENSKYVEIIK